MRFELFRVKGPASVAGYRVDCDAAFAGSFLLSVEIHTDDSILPVSRESIGTVATWQNTLKAPLLLRQGQSLILAGYYNDDRLATCQASVTWYDGNGFMHSEQLTTKMVDEFGCLNQMIHECHKGGALGMDRQEKVLYQR